MAKDAQRQQARIYYVEHGLTAKATAEKVGVAEKTLNEWVRKYNWKDIRLNKQTSQDVLLGKYNELMGQLLDRRMEFEQKKNPTDDDRTRYAGILDEMSKLNAIIERMHKDNKVSLRTHIHCLEKFFTALQYNKPRLFSQELIEFQVQYLDLLAEELK